MQAVPALHAGAKLTNEAVLGDGEFVPGTVLRIPGRSEETPLSGFVARLVALIDGRRTLAEIAAAIDPGGDAERSAAVVANIANAARILYVDGAIESLRCE